MAIIHSTAVRNLISNAVVDHIDYGTANPTGVLRVYTAGQVTQLVEIEFANPAFGASAGGVAQVLGTPLQDTATGSGTAAEFEILNRDRQVVVSGTVTGVGGGGDLELTSAIVTAGDVLRITDASYTAGT